MSMKKTRFNIEKVNEIIERLETMHPDAACALEHKNVFQLLVAVVLSAQTTDVSVNKVSPALFESYPTPDKLASADITDVEDRIRTIGLYKNKARNIVKLSQELVERFGGNVPDNFDDLVSLPGVGRKTANVVLAEAFGEERIAVDTHVFRVANRIGLTDEKDVNGTEEALMKVLPLGKWTRTHHLLIFHGRRICSARKPKCEECLLKDICISSTDND